MWETSLEAINRYNTVFTGIEEAIADGTLTEELGNQYKGECLFSRALTYHNLMIHFALPYNVEGNNNYGMPIYTKPVNDPAAVSEQLAIGRSSVKETYEQILKEPNEAEAAARAGDNTLALEKLNQVRNRSLADPSTQAYKAGDFANTKALVEAILWERRIEFHGEGRRWEDIHRLAADDLCPSGGIPAKIEYNNTKEQGAFVVGGEVKAEWFGSSKVFIPYTDKRFIWPIPLNDILRNPTLAAQQNAGW